MLGEFISQSDLDGLRVRARHAPAWLDPDAQAMDRSYNRLPFLVPHRLNDHPAFTMQALRRLCRRLGEPQVKFRIGKVPINTHFDTALDRYRQALTLDDAIDHLEETQAYIAVYNPERDPEYRPIIEGLLGELALHTERLDPHITWYSTYIFISANGSVTPYHMDREMNFLLQIRGTKVAKLWDPNDDEVMSPAEKDLLLSSTTRPTYRDSFPAKAMVFDLAPGLGVHHPFIAPHIVHTGPELSISLAITFRTARSDVWADAHRFNHRLRALGINPGRVGQSAWVDQSKAGVLRSIRRARAAWRKRDAGNMTDGELA